MKAIFCRYCNGLRSVTIVQAKRLCEGCGSHAANAEVPESSRQKKPKPQCPKCRSYRVTEVEAKRFLCELCNAVFEALDYGFVDDRPEQNAMKKERVR